MIELKNIKVVKDKELVLDNINLKFNNNGLIIFKGKFVDRQPLLKILAGYEKPESGEFFLKDKPLNYKNQSNLDNYRFNYVATALRENNFFEFLTVRENFELLNFYSRNIKEQDIIDVLEFLGLDKSVLELKSRALTKDQQQLLALSKPLLMKNNIIIVENPLKYLDTEEEVIRVSKILEKISKERLLFIFTNKDSNLDLIADQVVVLKNKTIVNIEYNNKQINYKENIDIEKTYLLKSPVFIKRVSFFLTKFNLIRNIILVILLSLIISLTAVSISTSFNQKSDKAIYEKISKDVNDPYLYLAPKMNYLEEETDFKLLDTNSDEEKKIINDNLFKRYYLSNFPYIDTKTKMLPLYANSFVEIPDNYLEEFKGYLDPKFENSKLPEENINPKFIEIAVTYDIALDIAKQYTLEGDDIYTLTKNNILRTIQFGNRTGTYLKIVGVFKKGLSLPEAVYSIKNQFSKLNILDEKRDFYKSSFFIDNVYLNNEIQDTKRINSLFNKLSGIKVYTKKSSTITQEEFNKYFDFVSTKENPINFDKDITKLKLKDDEVILTLPIYNTFVKEAQIQFVNNAFNRFVYDNLVIDFSINLEKLFPVDNEFSTLKLNKMKVVGVITPKNANKHRYTTEPELEEYLNNFILLSDNNVSKFKTNLSKPVEYFINKKHIDYNLFSKNFNYENKKIDKNTLLFTNKLLRNENFINIISGKTALSVLKVFITVSLILLVITIYISVKLTRGRLNKKVNLFSMFWSAGRSAKIIKLSYAVHLLILFIVSFTLSLGLSYLFMILFDSLAGYSNGLIVSGLYKFSSLTFLFIFIITSILYCILSIINVLLINRHVLTSDKDFL